MRLKFFDDLFGLKLIAGCYAEGDAPDDPAGGAAPAAGEAGEAAAAAAGGDAPAAPAAGAEDGDSPAAPKADWKDKQIDRQHRKLKEQEARERELLAENQRLTQLAESAARRSADPAAPEPPAARREEPTRQAAAPVEQVKEQVRLEMQIENLTETVKREYAAEWPTAYENFQRQGGIDPATLASIMATDDPAYVLVELGKNPDRYQELLDMPAARRQTEFIKLAMAKPKAAEPKPRAKTPSGAPAPVAPVSGGGAPSGHIDLYASDMSSAEKDADWYAERLRQKRDSEGRPWSLRKRSA